jgi:hypothetical protein
MAWEKNSAEAIRRFDELVAAPGAERKIMFVARSIRQRYAMLHENRVVLRLSEKDAAELIAKGGQAWELMKGGPGRTGSWCQRRSRKARDRCAFGSRGRFATLSPSEEGSCALIRAVGD